MNHYTVHGERKKGWSIGWTEYVSANSEREAREIAKKKVEKTFPDQTVTVTSVKTR